MSDIPPECIWEILSHVPTEPLLQFRCVCKAWCSIIDDAEFIKSHTLHQIESTRLIIRNDYGTRLHTLSLDSLYNSETRRKRICAAPVKTITHHGISRLPQLPVSSCYGLILIPHYNEKRMWVLWNHFTGEFRKLPLYVTSKGKGMHGCGLGYDSVSGDYKVVGIAPLLNGETCETLVYSLKSDSWRRIHDFPGMVQLLSGGNDVVNGYFLNGALNWFSYKQEGMQIIALDLGTENYRVLSLPSALCGLDLRFGSNLDVLGGSLFMSRCYSVGRMDSVWRVEIWIMNEYGKKDSWTKAHGSIAHHGISRLPQLPVSSCYGLILIPHYNEKRMWVLWNHFTGEFRKLPLYVTSKGKGMHGCGLGYDSVSGDYKVVGIAPLLNGETCETLVYSLKSDSWRRIHDFPGMVQLLSGGNDVVNGYFLNGALNWFSYKQEGMQIIALDLGTENYRVLSLPSALCGLDLRFGSNLDVLGGSLFMSRCYSVGRMDSVWRVEIWIMNEYGKKDSWTKVFSFAKRLWNEFMGLFRPMAYLKNKGLLLIQHKDKEFFWFDVDKKTAKRVKIHGAPSYFSCQLFPASLFRLNTDAGAHEGLAAKGTAKSKRKRTDDRLKLTLTFSN